MHHEKFPLIHNFIEIQATTSYYKIKKIVTIPCYWQKYLTNHLIFDKQSKTID